MRKHYILDSNILVENPESIEILRNGEENEVLIPYSVLMELDRLKRKPDLKHIISKIVDNIMNDDKIKWIVDPDAIYDGDANDDDIIRDLRYIKASLIRDNSDIEPIFVSNDKFFRVRVSQVEKLFTCQEFKESLPFRSESQLYAGFVSEEDDDKVPNSFYRDSTGGLNFYKNELDKRSISFDNKPWGILPRTSYQNAAMTLMLEEGIDVVTLQSPAGFGKTHVALACAFQLVLQKPKKYHKIFIFKPTVELGEPLGFLPGSSTEKISPYMRGIRDLIMKLHAHRPANSLFVDVKSHNYDLREDTIEILSINYIRGMNIEDSIVILDEGQNLSRYEMRALLTRMGQNTRCFILGDTSQVDHPHLNSANNGLNWVVKMFKGNKNYGHMVLSGSKSRGPICDLVLKTGL